MLLFNACSCWCVTAARLKIDQVSYGQGILWILNCASSLCLRTRLGVCEVLRCFVLFCWFHARNDSDISTETPVTLAQHKYFLWSSVLISTLSLVSPSAISALQESSRLEGVLMLLQKSMSHRWDRLAQNHSSVKSFLRKDWVQDDGEMEEEQDAKKEL